MPASFNPDPATERLRRLRPALEKRARIMAAIRGFFTTRGFLEVETPIRIPTPALEEQIDAQPSGTAWLRTSPELHMKRLLAAGYDKLFQIGPCFRHGEYGDRHNPEFCMLEWYRADADYRIILDDVQELIPAAVKATSGDATGFVYRGQQIKLTLPWHVQTVARAFKEAAGWDPVRDFDSRRFEEDLVNLVEPSLPPDRPTVLLDYPAEAAALARCRPDNPPVAERWELYIGGLELVNAFSELTDLSEQRQRFDDCAAARQAEGKTVYPLDHDFLAALESGMPPSAGAALGLDRLVMLCCNAANLDEVLPFRVR